MQARMKRGLWLGFFLGIAAISAAGEWEEFIGTKKVELLNSVETVPADFFVSLDGNDEWSGRLAEPNADKTDGPFRTFDRARLCVKEYRNSPAFDETPTVVEVRPGLYELDKTITFDDTDSGTPESPVIWRGVKGEDGTLATCLHGGKILTGAKQVSDPRILSRIKPEIQEKIAAIDLNQFGIKDFGNPDGSVTAEIFFGDQPLTQSRFPNSGFLHIEELNHEGNSEVRIRETSGVAKGKFYVREDADFAAWQNEPDPWVFGYWYWDWMSRCQKIDSIVPEKKYMELSDPSDYYGYRKDQYFYAYNLLCEIDQPGEYYIDRETGVLYFYPPEGYQDGQLMMPVLSEIVSAASLENFVFAGFEITGCRGTALTFSGHDIIVCGSLIRNTSNMGIYLNGNQNLIFGNHLYNMGSVGFQISCGNRVELIEGKSAAVNNDIHHYARIQRVYAPAGACYGCGFLLAHNRFSNAPHAAVIFKGNENRIEFNEIYDVCTETNDAGAVYCGLSLTERGNLIKNNYLHDISGLEGKGAVGVYLDDMFSGTDVIGNFFENVTRAAMIGGGRDCSIQNNIFVDCYPNIHVDARALGWAIATGEAWEKELRENGTINNIDYKSELWSKKYPKLRKILDGDPKAPEGDLVARNVIIHNNAAGEEPVPFDDTNPADTAIEDKAREYITIENNVFGGPGLLDALSKSDDGHIPHTKIPFERIPMERIGLFKHPSAVSR